MTWWRRPAAWMHGVIWRWRSPITPETLQPLTSYQLTQFQRMLATLKRQWQNAATPKEAYAPGYRAGLLALEHLSPIIDDLTEQRKVNAQQEKEILRLTKDLNDHMRFLLDEEAKTDRLEWELGEARRIIEARATLAAVTVRD